MDLSGFYFIGHNHYTGFLIIFINIGLSTYKIHYQFLHLFTNYNNSSYTHQDLNRISKTKEIYKIIDYTKKIIPLSFFNSFSLILQ